MKKLLLIAALLLSCGSAFSQKADKIFSDMKSSNGIDYMEVTKEMMGMMGATGDSKALSLFKGIDNLKMMEINDVDAIGEMRLKLADLEKGGYTLMIDQSEEGNQITIYTLKKGKKITEMFLIVQEGKECKLMLFKGDIDPNKLDQFLSFGSDDDE